MASANSFSAITEFASTVPFVHEHHPPSGPFSTMPVQLSIDAMDAMVTSLSLVSSIAIGGGASNSAQSQMCFLIIKSCIFFMMLLPAVWLANSFFSCRMIVDSQHDPVEYDKLLKAVSIRILIGR